MKLVQGELRRLFRGLKGPYDPEQVGIGFHESNFSDCPFTALQYANARRGVLLVVDIPETRPAPHVMEALWVGMKTRRFIVNGRFDPFIRAILPAKGLRKLVRAKGIVTSSDEHKSWTLRDAIEDFLRQDSARTRERLGLPPFPEGQQL